MSPAFGSGPYFISLAWLPVLSFLSPGPDFINFDSGYGSGFYQDSPEDESGSELYQCFSPGPDCINLVRIWVPILSIFESGSGSGFYQACPCPGPPSVPDSANTHII